MVEGDAAVFLAGPAPATYLTRAAECSSREEMTGNDTIDRSQQLEALAAEVGPLALGIACRMLGDRASAEDALQDAFLQAYRGLAGFRGDSSLRTWFLKILVNCCTRHRRIWRRWTAIQDQLSLGSESESEQIRSEGGDPALRDRLRAAVMDLPHRQRAAFVMRYTQDLGIAEIAEIMDCAPGTVKATIHKAVIKLRRELDDVR